MVDQLPRCAFPDVTITREGPGPGPWSPASEEQTSVQHPRVQKAGGLGEKSQQDQEAASAWGLGPKEASGPYSESITPGMVTRVNSPHSSKPKEG